MLAFEQKLPLRLSLPTNAWVNAICARRKFASARR